MYQIVYCSKSKRLLSAADLHGMLSGFRAHNAAHRLTGILLHSWGNFLQLLEGEEADVIDVFGRIQNDRRHDQVALIDIKLPGRMFSDWSMAFVDLTDLGRVAPGFAGFPSDLDLRAIDDATVLELLTFFGEQRGLLRGSDPASDVATRGHVPA
jgi:hypothetical protein